MREIKEETGLKVKIGKPFFVNEWRPLVREEPWQIIGIFFICFTDLDKVILGDDHDEFQWIKPQEYKEYNLIENLIPAFENYLSQRAD
ncbi:hypothetical protein KKF32_05105 [Patescibacteria group bacterium]|nr:hypothetical protein [Patescibacteria group bacterium]